jgi:hypothetical protein
VKGRSLDMDSLNIVALTVLATLIFMVVAVLCWWETRPFEVRGTVSDADSSILFVFNHPKPFVDTTMVDRILPTLPGVTRPLHIVILDTHAQALELYSFLMGRAHRAIAIQGGGGTVAKAVAALRSGENVAIFLEWDKCLRTGAAAILKESHAACYTGELLLGPPSPCQYMDLRPFTYSPDEELRAVQARLAEAVGAAELRERICKSPIRESSDAEERERGHMCPGRR